MKRSLVKTNSLEGNPNITYLARQLPTKDDNEAFEVVSKNPPTAASNPNLFAWYCLVMKFSPEARAAWAGAAAAGQTKGGKGKAPAKKEEKPKEDDDDFDPFAEEEGDAEAAEVLFNIKDITILEIKGRECSKESRRQGTSEEQGSIHCQVTHYLRCQAMGSRDQPR